MMDDESRHGPLVPRLATSRLVLRAPRLTDFDAFATNLSDPIVRANSGAPVISAREAWRQFHAGAGYWLLQGMGWWTVEEKGLGPIGGVGLFRRELAPDIEMAWSVYRQHWNKGYATEAAQTALQFAVGTLGIYRVIAHVAHNNLPSARVAMKIGMRAQGETELYGEAALLYAFERDG